VKLGEGSAGEQVSIGKPEAASNIDLEPPVEPQDDSPLATRLLDARKKRGADRVE
jgi:hypothetical protein